MNNIEILKALRNELPPVTDMLGYGSGIYQQLGYAGDERPEKDVIVVVDDYNDWLTSDFSQNPDHFIIDEHKKPVLSLSKNRGFYDKLGCLKFKFYGNNIKMMVMERKALFGDFNTWKHFGMPGRLSKPIIADNITLEMATKIENNRENILIAAFLFNSKDTLDARELYETISMLSYYGDFRTIFHCEKRTKTTDIVGGAYDYFEELYGYNSMFNRQGDLIENPHPTDLIPILPSGLSGRLKSVVLIDDDEKRQEEAAKSTQSYFFGTNLVNTPFLALSSAKTLGPVKSFQHSVRKFQKGLSN